MAWFLTAAGQFAVAAVLAVAACAKVASPAAFARFRDSLPQSIGLPHRHAAAAAGTVIVAEGLLALALAAAPALPALGIAALPAALLFAAFTAVVATMLRRGVTSSCHCFGGDDHPPGLADLVRNVTLTTVAAASAATWLLLPAPNTPFPAGAAAIVLITCLACLAAVVAVALSLQTVRRRPNTLNVVTEDETAEPPTGDAWVADFEAITLDGEHVNADSLRGETLVAFLSATCPACMDSVPDFLVRAQEWGDRGRVLAVVLGDAQQTRSLCARLTSVARVILEAKRGPVSRAFGVERYPGFVRLSDRVVNIRHFLLEPLFETTG